MINEEYLVQLEELLLAHDAMQEKYLSPYQTRWSINTSFITGKYQATLIGADTKYDCLVKFCEYADSITSGTRLPSLGRKLQKAGWPNLDEVEEYLQK